MRAVTGAVIWIGVRNTNRVWIVGVVVVSHQIVASDNLRGWERRLTTHASPAQHWVINVNTGIDNADLDSISGHAQILLNVVSSRQGLGGIHIGARNRCCRFVRPFDDDDREHGFNLIRVKDGIESFRSGIHCHTVPQVNEAVRDFNVLVRGSHLGCECALLLNDCGLSSTL